MIGILLAFGCAVFIALSQISLRKSYRGLKPSVAFFFDAVFGLAIWVPLALAMGVSAQVSWKEAFIFATISAVLSEAIVFYALSRGELAITATILATYPVYTVIFSRILNNEVLSGWLMIFVLLTIVGSVAASLPDKVKKSELQSIAHLIWPFIAAVCIGLSDTISKGYINRSDDFSLLLALGFVQIPVAVAYLRLEKESLVDSVRGIFSDFKTYYYALIGGLFNIIGTGMLWLSFSYAPASIASPITGVNGALTVVLSHYVLKDKISASKGIYILVTFVGVIGISLIRAS